MDIRTSARRYSRLIAGIGFPLAAVYPLQFTLDIAEVTPEQTRKILAISRSSLGIGGAILGRRAMHRELSPTLTMATIWGGSSISMAYVIAILAIQFLSIISVGFGSDWCIIPLLLKMLFKGDGSWLFIVLMIIGAASGLIFNRALADRGDSSSEDIPA